MPPANQLSWELEGRHLLHEMRHFAISLEAWEAAGHDRPTSDRQLATLRESWKRLSERLTALWSRAQTESPLAFFLNGSGSQQDAKWMWAILWAAEGPHAETRAPLALLKAEFNAAEAGWINDWLAVADRDTDAVANPKPDQAGRARGAGETFRRLLVASRRLFEALTIGC